MRKYRSDVTDVYRDKVTVSGSYTEKDVRWNPKVKLGDPWETVHYYGPYGTKAISGSSWWRTAGQTMKIEGQQLEVVDGELKWVTFRIKILEDDAE